MDERDYKAMNKLFEPNKNKKLFTITVEVFENCASTVIINDGEYQCTYHEIVGALETQKVALLMNQREKNLEHFKSETQQLRQDSLGRNLTPIAEWDKFDKCSIRLQNALCNIRKGTPEWVGYKEQFIENIQIHKMRKLPNCGKKSLNEFIELRGY